MRNAVKKLRHTSEKADAEVLYHKVVSLIDRLAKKNVIHDNKASNLKSKLALHINKL
jgi:small subunit ribosomal protein S20